MHANALLLGHPQMPSKANKRALLKKNNNKSWEFEGTKTS